MGLKEGVTWETPTYDNTEVRIGLTLIVLAHLYASYSYSDKRKPAS